MTRLLRVELGSAFRMAALLLASASLLILPAPLISAQTEQTGAVRGTIKAQADGSLIANARVTIVNEAQRLTRETTSDAEGRFAVLGLPPGTGSRVTVNAANFRPQQQQLPPISSGDSLSVDFMLEVASITESIDTTADTLAVVSNAPEVSQVVDARRISELPSNGRSLNRFALLDPHVRNTGGLGSDGSSSSRLSINASSFRHTHYRVDGNTNYEPVFANAPQQQISTAAVQEFKVLTNQYSAEYGGSSAGIISTTTKSGSDQFHGEGFVFLRPSGIQARPPVSTLHVPNELWQFGGAFGGPIIENRLNFFVNYERSRLNRGAFIQSPAPDTFIGKSRDGFALARADYRFNDRHSLGLRLNGNYSTNNNVNDAVSGFNQPSTAKLSNVQNVSTQLTDHANWGATLNELRVSYINTVPSASKPVTPAVTVVRPNYSTEGTSSYSLARLQSYQLADQLARQTGKHEVRVGGDYLRQQVNDDTFSLFGTYTFAPGAPRAGEVPTQYQQTFGRQLIRYGQTLFSAFAQDNWRVASRLTLNLGMRYELQSITDERNNLAPRLGFAWDVFGNARTVVRGGGGVFYDQYYFYVMRRYFFQGVISYTPTVTLKPGDAGFPAFPNSLAAPTGNRQESARDLYLSPDRLLNPYSTQFSFGIQQKLNSRLTLTVDAITQHTVRQMRPIDINAPAPFTRTAPGQARTGGAANATRPLRTYLGVPVRNAVVIENSGMSDYDALDVGLIQSFAQRLRLEAHYLYSNATTDSMFFGEPNTGVPNDWNNNLRLEHGPSDFHQRHRFVGHGLIEMPWHTQASFVLVLASGLPVDPRTGVDNNGDSNLIDRPVNPATGVVFARNSFRTPMQSNFDMSLAKRVALREGMWLELRAEAFNLFNRNNYVRLNATYGDAAAPLSTFLTPIAGISNSDPRRQFQFALKLLF